jgi:hypothetical protein
MNDLKRYSPLVDVEFVGGDPRMIFLDDEDTELLKVIYYLQYQVDLVGLMRYEMIDLMKK